MTIEQEHAEIKRRVASWHPAYQIANLHIGERVIDGVFAKYSVSYWCHSPIHLGGSTTTTISFDNDMEDAALRSASL